MLEVAARNMDQLAALLDSLRVFSQADRVIWSWPCHPGSTVVLAAKAKRGTILITVENEGAGFPAAEGERIFQKSVRLNLGASGLGMGLFVARAIVEAHHGHVSAKSREGHGATFEVSLPA